MQPHLFVDGADSVRVLTGGLGDLAGSLGAASEAAAVLATAGRPRSRAAATSVARS